MNYNNMSLKQGNQELPCFHDWIWGNLIFEYNSKQIVMQISSIEDKAKFVEIIFDNVIAFNMICCDFWGKSSHIDCITMMEEKRRDLIKQVFSEKKHCDYGMSCLKSEDDYVEVTVSGISGDRLTIACEYVIYKQKGQDTERRPDSVATE